jgi:polyisoprenoid-binding protein YceI
MKRSHVRLSAVLAALLAAPSAAMAQPLDDYALNPQASVIGFTVYARMLFTIEKHGRFRNFSGELSFDPEHPADTRVDLTVYTASVDMHDTDHETMLRSGDFFDVERFPTMHFVSAATERRADGSFAVTGDLTIRDVTKRIAIPVQIKRAATAGAAAVFETAFDIDRTEFGLNGSPTWGGMNVSIARNVQIRIAVAGIARNPAR